MRLLPLGAEQGSDWEDGLWVEKPGYPVVECSWIHPPPNGCRVPEFEFEEGNDKNKNEPGPVFYVGTGNDCHVRMDVEEVPEKVCRLAKEGRTWFLEALLPKPSLHMGDRPLTAGQRVALRDGDVFSLARPPTPLAYRVRISEEDNWYIDEASDRDYPNKYPGRFPFRSSLADAPPAPEELKRLAWQTDQMRKRSEEDQVRVSDWSAFSQYVKRYYFKYGIECISWADVGRQRPVDPPPPIRPARSYPDWICELVARERQLPGISAGREPPFASSLRASGREVTAALDFRGDPPKLLEPAVAAAPTSTAPLASPPASRPAPVFPVTAADEQRQARRLPDAGADERLRAPFRDWLESLDDSLFLMQYHDRIAATFDSLTQVYEIYVEDGELKGSFFEDAGIKKLGHRRIFEKWFRDLHR